MRIGKYKWVLFNILPFENKALEEYLEEMSVKGWILKGIYGAVFFFEKLNTGRRKYCLTNNVEDKVIEEKVLRKKEEVGEVRWEYISYYNEMKIFSTEDEVVTPSYEEKIEDKKIINKAYAKKNICNLTMIFLMCMNLWNVIGYDDKASYLASNGSLFGILFIAIYILVLIIESVRFFIWKKTDTAIKSSYKKVKIRNTLNNSCIFLFFISMLFFFLEKDTVLKMILVVGGILFLGGASHILIYKRLKNRKKLNLIVGNIIIFFVIIFSVGTITFWPNEETNLESIPLSLVEFGDTIDTSGHSYFEKSKSFLAKTTSANLWGENLDLDYDVFESKSELAMKLRVNQLRNYIEKYERELPKEEKVDFINDMIVYSAEGSYYLIGKNKVIQARIFSSEEIDDKEEILQIIYNKL